MSEMEYKKIGEQTEEFSPGDKVVCIRDDDNNWGNCTRIKDHMKIGDEFEVYDVSVHTWHTKLYLKGFLNKPFNSVHFVKIRGVR